MGREGKLSGALSVAVLARDVKKVDFTWEWYLFVLFFLSPWGKQGPESAQLLKNRYEEQEADEGDISDDEIEGKEGSNRDSSPGGVRQRSVPTAAPLEKS